MDPSLFQLGWAKGGIIAHTGGPTHRQGGNLDWFLHSYMISTGRATGHVVAGTDHTGVTVSLKADQHETLGYRPVARAGFDAEALKRIKASKIEYAGPIPDVWETWSREAEQWLRKHTNDKSKGNTGRGKEPVFRKQTLSRPQVGFCIRGQRHPAEAQEKRRARKPAPDSQGSRQR